jgi:GNAT superfamily N-acetyltransferase
MNLVTRFLTLAEEARKLLPDPHAVQIEPLDLDRDWPEIEALLQAEEWPFVRADLELGDAQPGDTSFVARKDGRFAGFFTAHGFPGDAGPVGYLDMLVIHPDFRGQTVARPLYLRTLQALEQAGARGLCVHTTNDSARLIRLLGFRPGRSFTLLIREPGPGGEGMLAPVDADRLAALDTATFGVERPGWTGWLASDDRVEALGTDRAAIVLRPRIGGAYSFDGCYAPDPADLDGLVAALVAEKGGEHALMAFAATDGPLHQAMLRHGFAVPDFFVPIGPLVEWRQGQTGAVGASDAVHSLLWL